MPGKHLCLPLCWYYCSAEMVYLRKVYLCASTYRGREVRCWLGDHNNLQNWDEVYRGAKGFKMHG